jgi:hypothetical protein
VILRRFLIGGGILLALAVVAILAFLAGTRAGGSGQEIAEVAGGGILLALAVVAVLAFLAGTRAGGSGQEVAEVAENTDEEAQKTETAENAQDKQAPSKTIPPMTGMAQLGETAEMGDRSISVNDLQLGYVFPHNIPKPDSGNEFMLMNITITNESNQPIPINMLHFQSEDPNGVRRNARYTPQAPNPIPTVGHIAPNGELTGNLAVEVPQGETNVKLVYRLRR